MSPVEKSKEINNEIYIQRSLHETKPKTPKFHVGDYVRVPDKRNIFSKGYTTNWNRELFRINKINNTTPVTYTIEDENGEVIEGKYYEQELLKSVFDFASNEKVLESMNIFHRTE